MPDCADPFNRDQVLVEDVRDGKSKCEYFMDENNSNAVHSKSKSEDDVTNTPVIEDAEETASTKAQTTEPKKEHIHTEDLFTQNVQGV